MTCSWWLAALWALYQLGSSCCNGYSISVINCDRPRNVKVYDFKSLCPTPLDPPKNTRKWVLLQQLKETIVKGVRCKVTKSTFRGYCGRWSHFKMASISTIEHPVDIPTVSCAFTVKALKVKHYQHSSLLDKFYQITFSSLIKKTGLPMLNIY